MSYALTDEVYATTVKEMEGNKRKISVLWFGDDYLLGDLGAG